MAQANAARPPVTVYYAHACVNNRRDCDGNCSVRRVYFGAWLQRKWTPDPIPAVNEVRKATENVEVRVKELHDRVDANERERLDRENFRLGIKLVQATRNNPYGIEVTNPYSTKVAIDSIQFFLDNVALSSPDKPAPKDNWVVPADGQQTIFWKPRHDPIMTLVNADRPVSATPYRIVLACRMDGKERTAEQSLLLWLTAGRAGLSQVGP